MKISELTLAGAIAGTEVFPIVQAGETRKVSIADALAGAGSVPTLQQVLNSGNSANTNGGSDSIVLINDGNPTTTTLNSTSLNISDGGNSDNIAQFDSSKIVVRNPNSNDEIGVDFNTGCLRVNRQVGSKVEIYSDSIRSHNNNNNTDYSIILPSTQQDVYFPDDSGELQISKYKELYFRLNFDDAGINSQTFYLNQFNAITFSFVRNNTGSYSFYPNYDYVNGKNCLIFTNIESNLGFVVHSIYCNISNDGSFQALIKDVSGNSNSTGTGLNIRIIVFN